VIKLTSFKENLPERIYRLLRDAERLNAVNNSGMIDSDPELVFDKVASTVALILKVPVAQVTFMDEHRQWLKSSVGFDAQELPTETSFCSYTLENTNNPTVALDATKDERFADNPFVKDTPNVRFYAGFPIEFQGQAIGTICAYDMQPHDKLTTEQSKVLVQLSREVTDILEKRAQTNTA
jgi:GAF domain-containing protein